jgi:hypothetical protein
MMHPNGAKISINLTYLFLLFFNIFLPSAAAAAAAAHVFFIGGLFVVGGVGSEQSGPD